MFTFSASLQGMKNDVTLYKKLESQKTFDAFYACCIESKESDLAIINAAKNPRLLTYCTYKFLPKEIYNAIGSYLSGPIADNYQHKLITYKWHNNCFNKKTIVYKDNDDKWDVLLRHDGTYSVVPKIATEYAMWNEDKKNLRCSLMYENKKYCSQLRSIKNKNGISYGLAVLDTAIQEQQNKEFLFCGKNYIHTSTSDKPISHYCYSSDGTVLAIEFPQKGVMIKSNTKSANGTTPHVLAPINGNVSALCAAHHSPIFVAGSDQAYSAKVSNLMVMTQKNILYLDGVNIPITHVAFSPDDSRLLTCSYDQAKNGSKLYLWDTTDFENIICIHSTGHESEIKKAFFIDNGQRIVIIKKNGVFNLFDSLTGKPMYQKDCFWHDHNHGYASRGQTNVPMMIWSSKYKLLITGFNDAITIRSSNNGDYLGKIQFWDKPIGGVGITIDEKNIIAIGKTQKAHHYELYDEQDCDEIAFIKEQAHIVQLYEMMEIQKRVKDSGKKTNFVPAMKKYIQEQQQKLEK